MRYQITLDYQGRLFKSETVEMSEEAIEIMREDFLNKASRSPCFSFTDEHGEIFIFPQDVSSKVSCHLGQWKSSGGRDEWVFLC